MSLSDKELLQLTTALDKILEARENKWIEVNNVIMYQILDAFSGQLAECLRAQTKLMVKLITGSDANDAQVDQESERISRMMLETLKR